MENYNKSSTRLQKSYFDVLGLCCSSEIPLVEKILNSIEGVKEFSVIVPTKTIIVVHDTLSVSQLQIAKALNQARLEANVRVNGNINYKKRWPSPFTWGSGALLLLSFIKFVYHPFRWLALGAVAIGIIPIFLKAVTSVRNLRLDTNILVVITVIGTVSMRDYIEAGTVVFLFGIAEWLEARAGHKAKAVMSSLMSIAPQRAVLAETGEEVDVNEVKLNTVLAVKPGEVIPIDGVVLEGKCEVDEKTLTGESFPVPKEKDSTVWAGTINLNGYITVKTTALAEDCVVAKMTKLVEEAQNKKSKTERLIDKCAQYYTPAVIIASVSLVVVPLALQVRNRNHWFHLALVVLVSACPCALILSTPVATFCALTKAATTGILVKGGDYLETMAKIKLLAFDKTGTLTSGEFVVNDFQCLSHDISSDSLLYWVSSIESKSSHPMAAALVDYAKSLSVEPKPEHVEEFQNYPGEGIHGRIDGKSIYIGNRKIALRAGSATVPNEECNKSKGKTVGLVYWEGKPAGIFSLSDKCRTGAKEAINELKLLSIKTAMLTGDTQSAAMHAQEELGNSLEEVHAELLPEDKARIIESFRKEGTTAMVGDGINDAPALASADIGISMGVSGSALATETGQVILLSNDIRKVPKAITLARKAHRKVIENVFLSIATKAAILALAFAGHPLVWAAVLADVGTCLVVILNSMLLLRGTTNHPQKCCKSSSPQNSDKHGSSRSCHNHKQCCSDEKVSNTCRPEKFKTCTSGCKSGDSITESCEGKVVSDSRGKQIVSSIGACRINEANHCDDGSCQMGGDELEANNITEDHCSGCHNSGMGNAAAVRAQCVEDDHLHVAEHCKDYLCQMPTGQVEQLTPTTHCLISNHCKEHVESQINDASLGKNGESSCSSSNWHQHRDVHHDLNSCCIGKSDHVHTRTNHACSSLKKRQTGSCCRSYLKECCYHVGHSPSSRFIGLLSEIVTE